MLSINLFTGQSLSVAAATTDVNTLLTGANISAMGSVATNAPTANTSEIWQMNVRTTLTATYQEFTSPDGTWTRQLVAGVWTDWLNRGTNSVNTALLPQRTFKNFKPSNTRRLRRAIANARAGVADGVLALVGDSTTMGTGAGTGTNGWTGGRIANLPYRLSQLLSTAAIPCDSTGVPGSNNVTLAEMSNYDPRLTLGAGWSVVSAAIGGAYFDNSTTTNAFAFAPGVTFDTIDYWYLQVSGYGTFTIDIDGGAAIETVNASGSTLLAKHTLTVARGTHTINWKRVSGGNVRIVMCQVRDGTTKRLSVWNLGVSGATSLTAIASANVWNVLPAVIQTAPDAVLLTLGINDWNSGVPVADFTTNMQTFITSVLPTSDIILGNPCPQAVANTSQVIQQQFYDAIVGLANLNDLPMIDYRSALETYEIAQPLGEYYNPTHPNNLGYAIMASAAARGLQAVDM